MHTLKHIASAGRIVLLSFHQPSPAMFNLLDRSYLMAEGYCVFSGPPAAAAPWFASHGLPCPKDTAIAEHMLHVACERGSLRRLLAGVAAAGGVPPGGVGAGPAGGGLEEVALVPGTFSEGDKDKVTPSSSGSMRTESMGGESDAGARDATQAAASAAAIAATPPLPPPLPQQQQSKAAALTPAPAGISRELAVLFWRTLTDIVRNPALLLLHWCAPASLPCVLPRRPSYLKWRRLLPSLICCLACATASPLTRPCMLMWRHLSLPWAVLDALATP